MFFNYSHIESSSWNGSATFKEVDWVDDDDKDGLDDGSSIRGGISA